MISHILFAVLASASLQAGHSEQVVYGKYADKSGDTTANSIFLFKPSGNAKASGQKLPLVLQFHPGGFFTGGPTTAADATVNAYLSKGIAYASVGYRLVTTKYYYGTDKKVEELVHVSAEGKLSLDTAGKTMDDYKIRVGRQECITKYLWDMEQMIEYIITNQDTLGVDPQRVVFTGESAGGAAINHLTWVYHQWNVGRYTPRGMIYSSAQLSYPVDNMLDRVANLFVDDLGADVRLSSIMTQSTCNSAVGNNQCSSSNSNFPPQTSDYNLCNKTWNDHAVATFCGDGFATATLGELAASQRWPREDPEVGLGMEKLWYAADNMQTHQPSPFYMYIANPNNGTGTMDIPHEALYARSYAKYAAQAAVNYTVYYTDYANMKQSDKGTERVQSSGWSGTTVWNYRSSHDWRSKAGVSGVEVSSDVEQVLFACLALGVKTSAKSGTVFV